MAEIGFSLIPDHPEPSLKSWIIEQLSDLRDRMRRDVTASDERLAVATAEAERKIEDAQGLLGVVGDL